MSDLGAIATIFLFLILIFVPTGMFIRHARRKRRYKLFKRQYPDSPWMWVEQWRGCEIRDNLPLGEILLCLIWGGCVLAGVIGVTYQAIQEEIVSHPNLLRKILQLVFGTALILFFGILSFALIFKSIRTLIYYFKYGRAVFSIEGGTGVIGGMLIGTVCVPLIRSPEGSCAITLECIRKGYGRYSSDRRVWQSKKAIPTEELQMSSRSIMIPVSIEIPGDCEERTNFPIPDIVWRLTIHIPIHGIDYKKSFDIPVFKKNIMKP